MALIEAAGAVEGPRGLRDRALLELLYGTGARISEAVGLAVDDARPRAGRRPAAPARAARSASSRSAATRCGPSRSTWCGPGRRWRPTGGAACAAGRCSSTCAAAPLSRQSAWAILRSAAERAGASTGRGLAAHAAALVRDPPARRRGRRPRGPGAARPRLGDHHAGLHAGHRRPAARGLRDEPPAGAHADTRRPAVLAGVWHAVRLEQSHALSVVAMSTSRPACLLGKLRAALRSVLITRAGRTADRNRNDRDRARGGGNRPMATRADAASAVARPHDSGPEMGAISRQDPAKARQRPLPEPKPLTRARARPHHRDVQPEGRRRQDDVHHQPGCRADRVRPARAADRPRPAGCAVGRARASRPRTWTGRSTTP